MRPLFGLICTSLALTLSACAGDGGTVIQVVRAPWVDPGEHLPSLVAYRIRYLRVQEENAVVRTTGGPRALPVGQCTLHIPVDALGNIDGPVDVDCDNPALTSDMRLAVAAAAPFVINPGTTRLNFGVVAGDPEPGQDQN